MGRCSNGRGATSPPHLGMHHRPVGCMRCISSGDRVRWAWIGGVVTGCGLYEERKDRRRPGSSLKSRY